MCGMDSLTKDRVAAWTPVKLASIVVRTATQASRELKRAGAKSCRPAMTRGETMCRVVCPRGVDKKASAGSNARFKVESMIFLRSITKTEFR